MAAQGSASSAGPARPLPPLPRFELPPVLWTQRKGVSWSWRARCNDDGLAGSSSSRAVKLVRERDVTAVPSSRDVDDHVNVLRKWLVELAADPGSALPGHGQMRPASLDIERPRARRHIALGAPSRSPQASQPAKSVAEHNRGCATRLYAPKNLPKFPQ